MPALRALPPGGRAPERVIPLRTADGLGLRAALWLPEGARAHALLLPGRAEYLEKMGLAAAHLAARGIATASLDWRGQGLSDRLTARRLPGHVDAFPDFQHDLAALLASPEVAALPGPRFVLAHSMGGAIALRWLAGQDRGVAAAILSAPLVGIAFPRLFAPIARAMAWTGTGLGFGHRWPPGAALRQPYSFGPFDGNVLTSERANWDWLGETLRAHPDLALAGPSFGWMLAAFREIAALKRLPPPTVPVMVFAGSDERVIDLGAIRQTAERIGARYAEIPEGRHELLIERSDLRAMIWREIDAFLAPHLPSGTRPPPTMGG